MEVMSHHQIDTGTGQFSRDPTVLPMAERTKDVVLNDGDELDLHIAPVANRRAMCVAGSTSSIGIGLPTRSHAPRNVISRCDCSLISREYAS